MLGYPNGARRKNINAANADNILTMLTHISFSSILLFLHNPAAWQSKYLLGIKDQKTTPAALVGTAFHRYMELILKGQPDEIGRADARGMIRGADDVDWGKTGSVDKCLEELDKLIMVTQAEWPEFHKVLNVELGVEEKIKGIRLPIKAYVDLIYQNEDGTVSLLDWKTVRSYEEELLPSHILQAMYYYWVVGKRHPEWRIKNIHFAQVKASENKDKTPQIKNLTLTYSDHPEYDKAIKKLTNLTIKEMNKKRANFLPNLRDAYEGQAEFDRFISSFKK